jgi:hypothetical protein
MLDFSLSETIVMIWLATSWYKEAMQERQKGWR